GSREDAGTRAVHVVTLAEEMPVAETLETSPQLRDTLEMPLGWVVVNRLHRRRFAPEVIADLAAAARSATDARALLGCVAERAAEESGWAAINQADLERVRAGTAPAPLIQLPFLFVEGVGSEALERLSLALEEAVGGGTTARAVRRRS